MRLRIVVATGLVLCGTMARAQEEPALTPGSLQAALAARPEGAQAERLAERIRTYFGGTEALVKGAPAKIDELTVAWALEAPALAANAPAPRVVSDAGNFTCRSRRSATSGLYAGRGHAGARHGVQRGTTRWATGGSAAGSSRSMKRTRTAASSPACRRGP